ncbi:sugar ABC transporter permease [Halomicroarcula sp. F28]|uniref:carbohydrate ABC transporter permease n=1 Tax=Haloarcula salinisoli TaxID=2487746 RepID=UPI001C738558|nr:sugar ABC transporter permease [Halomicroarcula salinisoli]MBX0287705.1 sugar ABC transporter permease [Halomicroarcula salinisoli]
MATETGQRRSASLTSPRRWVESLSDTQFAYLLLTPCLLVFGVIAFWPLARTFQMSLHADLLYGAERIGPFVGFENYVELLTGERNAALPRPFFDPSQLFTSALTVTIIFTVVSVFFETLLGFGQALILNQEFRGRRWARVAIILPWAVPIVIQGMIFFLLFQPTIGFLVEPLQQLGIFSSTPQANSVESLIIVIVADVWKTSAFMALIILAGLQSIDRSLYDVADVAGASKFERFKTITLPLVLPSVLVAMLFRTIGAMRVFGLIETVSSCSTVPSLSCLVVQAFSSSRYASAATVAFVTAAIIGIVVSVYIVKFADVEGGGGF